MAMAGYNPNVSLLPHGGGPIQAMSGGGSAMSGGYHFAPPMGYNDTASILPSVGGVIPAYHGGFYNQNMSGGLGDSAAPTANVTVIPAPTPAPPTAPTAPPTAPPTAARSKTVRRGPDAAAKVALSLQKLEEAKTLETQKIVARTEQSAKKIEQAAATGEPTNSTNSKIPDKEKQLMLFGTSITH